MSFIEELKRRNVFRVGIAYAVGAWLILQLTEVLSELLNLPEQVGPVVVAAVVIGFPLALFLAWVYELTPDGVKRESEVDRQASVSRATGRKLNALIIALLSVAVLVLLFDRFVPRGGVPEARDLSAVSSDAELLADPPARETASDEPEIDPRSIAVLPFDNRSPVSEDEFFIDGIHDDLLTNLALVSGLKVISRTSVSRYRESPKSIPEIAAELGVATIMEGAVQRAGNTVRINVQLIDAFTDEHLWAQIYDREMTTENLFAIQSEIAESIAAALETQLTPDEERRLRHRPTENLEAYGAYLRGMRAFATREVAAMQEALADFQQAVALDPEFALGWAGIAQVAEVLPSWSSMTVAEGRAISEPAARMAMALAPDNGEANLALAMVLTGDESLRQFEKAVDMLPNHPMALAWYANSLQGPPGPDWIKALTLLTRAVDVDPLSPHLRSQLARQLLMMNRWEEAGEQLQIVLDSNPDYAPVRGFLSWQAGGRGDLDEAVIWSSRYLELDPRTGFATMTLVWDLGELQDRERLVRIRDNWTPINDQDMTVRAAEMMIARIDGRYAAALENVVDLGGPGNRPGVEQAWLKTYQRAYDEALADWSRVAPSLFDASQRDDAVRQYADIGCVVADVLRRQGEQAMADLLVADVVTFVTEELPRYKEYANSAGNLAYCHAYRGDFDAAMDEIESNLRNRQFVFWWQSRALELFDPLKGNARYEALMQAFEAEMARQRASLDRLEQAEEASGP